MKKILPIAGIGLLSFGLILSVIISQERTILRQRAFVGTPLGIPTPTPTPTPPPITNGIITQDSRSLARASVVPSITWSHTIGTYNNMILIVGVSIGETSARFANVVSVTYNGVNLTKINALNCPSTNGYLCRDEMWYLKNPQSGTHDIAVTLSAARNVVGGAVSYYNVDQINPIATSASNSGQSNTASVSITSNTSQLIVDKLAGGLGVIFNPDTSQTLLWRELINNLGSGSSKTGGAGSTTMKWITNQTFITDNWAEIAVALNPSATTSITPTPTPTPPPGCVYACTNPTPTPTPFSQPTNTPVPFATNTPVPLPTPTPIPGASTASIQVSFSVMGIPDSSNPAIPLHTTRNGSVDFVDANNNVTPINTTFTFDSAQGVFTANIVAAVAPGIYLPKIDVPGYLHKALPLVTLTQTSATPNTYSATVVNGDINADNSLDIIDFQALFNCYNTTVAARPECAPADLNDDGNIDAVDFNIFLRSFSTQHGD